ncbi:hypothetical protein PMS91_09300, partial [Bifidobacterium longum]|nr:hypothetical protein [Bifidobacterium longum]MDB6899651.1 hypothetical protein [Bifidobacterium longum]MDB6903541.1 hypothetical protein [Bifidobacterium longum]
RTQDAGHALLRQTRNPKVRKKSGVIAATNLVENFTFILFLLPWDISTSFICQPTRGMCA